MGKRAKSFVINNDPPPKNNGNGGISVRKIKRAATKIVAKVKKKGQRLP